MFNQKRAGTNNPPSGGTVRNVPLVDALAPGTLFSVQLPSELFTFKFSKLKDRKLVYSSSLLPAGDRILTMQLLLPPERKTSSGLILTGPGTNKISAITSYNVVIASADPNYSTGDIVIASGSNIQLTGGTPLENIPHVGCNLRFYSSVEIVSVVKNPWFDYNVELIPWTSISS